MCTSMCLLYHAVCVRSRTYKKTIASAFTDSQRTLPCHLFSVTLHAAQPAGSDGLQAVVSSEENQQLPELNTPPSKKNRSNASPESVDKLAQHGSTLAVRGSVSSMSLLAGMAVAGAAADAKLSPTQFQELMKVWRISKGRMDEKGK